MPAIYLLGSSTVELMTSTMKALFSRFSYPQGMHLQAPGDSSGATCTRWSAWKASLLIFLIGTSAKFFVLCFLSFIQIVFDRPLSLSYILLDIWYDRLSDRETLFDYWTDPKLMNIGLPMIPRSPLRWDHHLSGPTSGPRRRIAHLPRCMKSYHSNRKWNIRQRSALVEDR